VSAIPNDIELKYMAVVHPHRLPHGILRSRAIEDHQSDIALALVLKLFSTDGLRAISDVLNHTFCQRVRALNP
jgi:hypothetical protein